MNQTIIDRIRTLTGAERIQRVEEIQPLWSNYGTLSRIFLDQRARYPSVILKHIQIPQNHTHPRGFTSDVSRDRKIHSYKVETHWYKTYNHLITESDTCATATCLGAFDAGDELFILLEDLSQQGYFPTNQPLSWDDITVVLSWLAHFHAQFMHYAPDGLWDSGTYWHLNTRPEELHNIRGTVLHTLAPFLDAQLRTASFQTFVHGDAKVANFLFHRSQRRVAAVDFQYVGRGCGMKDVAYFIGSCLREDDCEKLEHAILEHYFSQLNHHLMQRGIDGAAVEKEWRPLYPMAWADFQRFLHGWSPQHRKIHQYSQRITRSVIEDTLEELLNVATEACLAAGKYIRRHWKHHVESFSKGMESAASDIVTEVDLKAQEIVLSHLKPTMKTYALGLLAEEGEHDSSRLNHHAYWAIDPLDGTLFFVKGQEGFATSIALVSQEGEPILGVVYDPVNQNLYHAIRGRGFHINGERYQTPALNPSQSIIKFADRSLRVHPCFESFQSAFELRFTGGAVMNIIGVILEKHAFYGKIPKKSLGGCAIWDLAAVALMLTEANGSACFYDGSPMHLNRKHSIYFNDVGLFFLNANLDYEEIHGLFEKILDRQHP